MRVFTSRVAPANLPITRRDELVLAELVKTAYGGSRTSVPSTAYANVAAALMLYAMFRGSAESVWLYGWMVVEVAYQLVRVGITRLYWRRAADTRAASTWARVFAVQSFLNGSLWGAASIIFFSPQFKEGQALLAVLLCGLAAGAIPVTAMLRPAFLGTAGTILLPFVVRNLYEWDSYHITMGTMLGVFLVFLLSWGKSLNRLLTDAYAQRIENQVLLELAERANLAKSRFLAAASHDLRQPLHALSLFAGALLDESDPLKVKRIAENIGTSITALNLLLNSLLDISKLDAGAVEPKITSFPAQDVFDSLLVEFAPLAAEKQLRLRIRATEAILKTDQVLFERIVRNLLANAIRYTERGTVFVGCRRASGSWRVEVRDSGIGIAQDKHQEIFGEFVQLGNPERDREKGLGLGLAIVSRLGKLLGCAIGLKSVPGRGSAFTVEVPAGYSVVQQASILDYAPPEKVRVLVIDDESSVRGAITAQLDAWKCDTIAAESLADALQKMAAASWTPDIVLCDLRLRGDELGTAVLAHIRQQVNHEVPCVLITGDIAADRLKIVQDSGFPVLHKPVSPSRLRALIGSLVMQ